ncbi:FapA family protein [Chitinispirillales bacterium ANBcel5]|uniref:DUF342 domain-containing protein n=1 Tax=Cellulosispirillum alkaliphilum TaxID=3039283 RepID=UPI002A4E7404|nr:FapA family protein [Chitinispirillales bacterium ANBcel5]
MDQLDVKISSDFLTAALLIPVECKNISFDNIMQFLAQKKIVYGVKEKNIHQMISEKKIGSYTIIASGKPVERGRPGKIQLLIDTSKIGKPKELKCGKVDHKNLGLIVNVKKGTPLARRIPSVRGSDGITVFGKTLPAPQENDVILRVGTGTEISVSDPNLLVASIDGYLRIAEDTIEVHSQKVINGDIDYATGNISLDGDLKVTGSIKAGFEVHISGSLVVYGCAEETIIKCGGSIQVRNGIAGSGSGLIECGGKLSAKFISNFTVNTDSDCTVYDDILHSSIISHGRVTAKNIVGGYVAAANGIRAKEIGNVSETKTIVDIDHKAMKQKQRSLVLSKLKESKAKLNTEKKILFDYLKNHMDQNGNIQDLDTFDEMKHSLLFLYINFCSLQKQISDLESSLTSPNCPIIKASVVYPNVVANLGNQKRLIKKVEKSVTYEMISDEAPCTKNDIRAISGGGK